jgi:hypothetical protein
LVDKPFEMLFPRIDATMATCKAHLDATGAHNTEIETYLVGYALTVVCAEYELRIEALLCKRAERSGDGDVHSFVKNTIDKIVRSPNIGAIAGALGHFGSQCKTDFQALVTNTPAHAAYDGIVNNRQLLAHLTGHQMTFPNLEKSLQDTTDVFDAIGIALGLTAAELATLA